VTFSQFINYCKTAGFSHESLETLSFQFRLLEFNDFLNHKQLDTAIRDITYAHLIQFIADFNDSSIHVKKARIWSLRQFCHFLKVNKIIDINIAMDSHSSQFPQQP